MNRAMKTLLVTAALLLSAPAPAHGQRQGARARLERVEESLKADVPRVLCLSRSLATGGQPTEQAFARLAENGFRSVLNLRTASEGVDLERERAAAEAAGLRYLHLPFAGSSPRAEQADEFIRLVGSRANHPMLIHCATANRVGALMMIYRVVAHGWSLGRAEEEAARIGLRSEELRRFARDYIARRKAVRATPRRGGGPAPR